MLSRPIQQKTFGRSEARALQSIEDGSTKEKDITESKISANMNWTVTGNNWI